MHFFPYRPKKIKFSILPMKNILEGTSTLCALSLCFPGCVITPVTELIGSVLNATKLEITAGNLKRSQLILSYGGLQYEA